MYLIIYLILTLLRWKLLVLISLIVWMSKLGLYLADKDLNLISEMFYNSVTKNNLNYVKTK